LSISLGVTSREDDRRGYPMIPISGFRVGLLDLANDLGVTESTPMLFLPLSPQSRAPQSMRSQREHPEVGVWGLYRHMTIIVIRIQRRFNTTASQDAASIFTYSRGYLLRPSY
jgi:hypothetical protein